MKKCILFNPPSALNIYSNSKVKAAIPKLPVMSLAMIAGSLRNEDFAVRITDLTLIDGQRAKDTIKKELLEFRPDIVGATATTPLFYEAAEISDIAKSVSTDILTVLGGPHASSLPLDCLKESSFDIVIAGEGEMAIREIAQGGAPEQIKGAYTRRLLNEETSCPCVIKKADDVPIDNLPLPALELFSAKNYICPKVIARNNPVGPIEISRGCVFNCVFCNKKVHGRRFRIKTPKRVIEELLILKKLGYREFHVLDDQFTTEINKAKEVCEEIIRKEINMTWNLRTGIRVDRVDQEFLTLAKRAGCYQVGIGFESGNQACLDKARKEINLQQAIETASMIKKAGIEVIGFFMLGLPGETQGTMEETIKFAIKLNLDYAKATILVPFPGTEIYDEYEKKGLIITRDWSRYNFHNAHEIYRHPALSWGCLNRYYKLFHQRFYLRPEFLSARCWKSILRGRFFTDLYFAYQTFLQPPNFDKVNAHKDKY